MRLSLLLMAALSASASAQDLGAFTDHADVGDVRFPGTVVYRPDAGTYTISGSGANMWATTDEFHMVYRQMTGDFILTADMAFEGEGVDPHRKIGWIVRESLDPEAPYVDAALHGDGLMSLQYRAAPGDSTYQIVSDSSATVVRLARRGGVYSMSVARRGEPFTTAELAEDVALGDEVLVGLFVCSHNPDVVETATFSNVRVTVPAAPDFQPYQDYIGARLETVDVETGQRRVVLSTSEAMQAPNWTPDGASLIVNQDGRLYRVDVETGAMAEIPTGFATANNNDHALSPDGSEIAISHYSDDHDGVSIIYVVPVDGGTPRQVTPRGQSYLHGWSPDGQTLIYTAERGDGNYDIWSIPTEGGEETRLTRPPGRNDGSEFSPDGAWIYFNSSRGGTMQIWRMRPDGSDPEQLTQGGTNAWFPHPSPDGRWVAYLVYEDPIDPEDHPWYENVTLRVMPADGGPSRVVAYLYGGQGTINVPSWSPDSRRLAFVSNTAF